jgi:putative spermidine/putrescine transport system ATP-binding protein
MARTPAPLRLEGISKSFGQVRVLHPLDLDVADGEMLALLGPSGCGKTTTLRVIAGFEAPDSGRVMIGARDLTKLPPNKRSLGMVFQNYSLFPHMTVAENVAFGLKMRGANRAERARVVRTMLDTVRLAQFEDRQVHQLSGGQQQRVALARALATEPSVLLLDEPLGALDKALRERMQFELRQLQRRFGITSILVTHDQEEALTISDRIAVMEAGRVVQLGAPSEVYARPRTRFVSEFLGTANIFSGTVECASGPDEWLVDLRAQAGARGCVREKGLRPGQEVMFAIRPERTRIGASAPGRLQASVQDVVFRGTYYAYELALDSQDALLFAYTQMRQELPPGGLVSLDWDAADATVLQDGA